MPNYYMDPNLVDERFDPDDDSEMDDEFDGCLHGVPWDEICEECDENEDLIDGL